MKEKDDALHQLAVELASGVTELFKERNEIRFSKDPVLERKSIIEYEGRMRADGMQKFNNPTFLSTVNFYTNAKDMEKHNALGVLIVYIEQGYVVDLMRLLKYPPADEENEDAMRDCCGTLCNLISGRFKTKIVSLGYVEPEMSHFSNYKNSVFGGVEFCYQEFDKYEISFFIDNKKRLVLEMTMGRMPRSH